jgi:hypothetical protein
MRLIALVLLVVSTGAAQAAGIGVRAGTTGLGVDLGWGVMPTLGARVGVSGGQFDIDFDASSVHYDGRAKLSNLNALLDWSPAGPFRITAGLVATGNKVDVAGRNEFGTLNGTVKSGRSVAPYLGVGYGNVWTTGVNFYFDVGVMFQGSPKAELSLSCAASVSASDCARGQRELDAERRDLEDELKRFKYYPVVNIGLTIGF